VLIPSLLFIGSFSLIFILLGMSATVIGSSLNAHKQTLEQIGGILIIAMGVLFLMTPFVNLLNREWHSESLLRLAGRGGPVVAGAAFAIAWTRARASRSARSSRRPPFRAPRRTEPAAGLLFRRPCVPSS